MEQKNTITIDGTEYIFEEMTDVQQLHVLHVQDIEKKMRQKQFEFDQLRVAKGAFVELLKKELQETE